MKYTIDGDKLLVEKVGWEPPADIDGYQRDKDNHWLFHRIWPECKHRREHWTVRGACGCPQIIALCLLKKAWVKCGECASCELAEPQA